MDNGWIKLHRKLLSSYTWTTSTPEQKVIMITLLLMANHEEKEWKWKGQRYQARPGEFITSLPSIKEKCGKDISIQNIRTALKKFEEDGFLTNESTKQSRRISITNWSHYQIGEDQSRDVPTDELTDRKNVEMPMNTSNYDYLNGLSNSQSNSRLTVNQQTINSQSNSRLTDEPTDGKNVEMPMESGVRKEYGFNVNRQRTANPTDEKKEEIQNLTSNKKTRNNNNNIKDILSSKPGKEIPFKEIIDYLNSKAEKNYKASTDKTKSCIKARYNEGFKKEDFIKVIDNKCKEWKGDPKMDRYLRPETLFGPKFESYLNERPISTKPVQPIQNKTRQPSMSERDFDDDYFEQFYDYALNANLDDIMNPNRKE
jgi:uncharacterized phage protein (TIGR02220 family)